MEYEKRKHSRTVCEIDSSVRNLETATKAPFETLLQDISESGVRFRANEFIPVTDKLLFRIKIPNNKTIEAIAKPAWIREIPSVSQYELGARFISLSPADQEIIRQFVHTARPAV